MSFSNCSPSLKCFNATSLEGGMLQQLSPEFFVKAEDGKAIFF